MTGNILGDWEEGLKDGLLFDKSCVCWDIQIAYLGGLSWIDKNEKGISPGLEEKVVRRPKGQRGRRNEGSRQ